MKTSPIENVKKLYEMSADSYNKMMESEISLPVYSDTLFRLSERIKGLPGSIVDTSCGSGHMLDLYCSHYDSQRLLVGIDLSPRMAEIASKKLGVNAKVLTADMRELNVISSGSAAAVISFFALHHLDPDNILTAFKEWNRILCKQGQLIVAVWEGTGPIDYGDESDVIALRYNKEEVTAWIIDSGFSVNQCLVEPVEDMPMDAIYLEASKQ